MLFLQKVNEKVNSINGYVNKYLESNQFEKNLKESINNKNYGVANSTLYELSVSTYDINYYKRVVDEVFKAIQEKPSKWRRIYKSLRLCEYVMKHGCDYFICEVKQREELITKLTHFTYLEDLRDKGAGVREISTNIIKLLKDNEYLERERKEAAKRTKIYDYIESKPLNKKKSFFARRREKKNNLKQTKSEPNWKLRPEREDDDRGVKSRGIFDEIIRERNMLYEQNRLISYGQSRYNRHWNSSGRSFSGSSLKNSSDSINSDSERERERGKERERGRERKQKKIGSIEDERIRRTRRRRKRKKKTYISKRRKQQSNSSSRTSRNSSYLDSNSSYRTSYSSSASFDRRSSSSFNFRSASNSSSSVQSSHPSSFSQRQQSPSDSSSCRSFSRSRSLSSSRFRSSLSSRSSASKSLHTSFDPSLEKRRNQSSFSQSSTSRSQRRYGRR